MGDSYVKVRASAGYDERCGPVQLESLKVQVEKLTSLTDGSENESSHYEP